MGTTICLKTEIGTHRLGHIHEHFSITVEDLSPFCDARLVRSTETVREGSFLVMKLSEYVRSTHGQDGAVVLDILHGQMFRLNLVGSRMVELLKQGHAEPEITERVSQEFGVAREIVAADCKEFFAHLEKHHLLELAGTSSLL
jgi:Coenzyme PQQ synthesis protein D (PqqD)